MSLGHNARLLSEIKLPWCLEIAMGISNPGKQVKSPMIIMKAFANKEHETVIILYLCCGFFLYFLYKIVAQVKESDVKYRIVHAWMDGYEVEPM